MKATTITPFLWFDREAEEAARLYVSLFPDSSIGEVQRFPEGGGAEEHGNDTVEA